MTHLPRAEDGDAADVHGGTIAGPGMKAAAGAAGPWTEPSETKVFDPTRRLTNVRAAVVLVLLTPALAGCLGATLDPRAATDLATTLPVFLYACPGDDGKGASDPCLSELPRATATNYQQPYVAVHPTNPRIFAVGATLANPDGERVRHLAAGDRVETTLGIYITEDAGAAWRETFAPPPADADPLVTSSEGEAALLFDPEGRLHVAGVARTERVGDPLDTNGNGLRHIRAFYARSDDLGKSWSASAWLDDDDRGADRPWIVRDPETGVLYVAWQETLADTSERTSVVAWSTDDGTTWSHLDPEERPPCFRGGMPVAVAGVLRLACVRDLDDAPTVVQIYAFDPRTRSAMLIAEILVESGYAFEFPFLTLLADGTLVMVYDQEAPEGRESVLLHSADGGMTWTPSGDARVWSPDVWDRARVSFSAADTSGAQHLLVRYDSFATPLPTGDPDLAPPPGEHEVRHVVLDRSGAPVHDVVLDRWHADYPPVAVQKALVMGDGYTHEHPRCGNCYDGLAWAGDRALIAFGRPEIVRLASVEATGATADPISRMDWPPLRPYVPPPPPPPPPGLDEPVEYEFTGHVDLPYCDLESYPALEEVARDRGSRTFEFEVPADTRFVNGTLEWATTGPTEETSDLDLMLYDAEEDAFDVGTYDVPETFASELRTGDQGAWTAVVKSCRNPPTDFTLSLELS